MAKTSIEWCDYSWPVINGCAHASPGCLHCYAERLTATRLRNLPRYKDLATYDGAPRWTRESRLDVRELAKPLHWSAPRRIFVCDMGDLFYEKNTNEEIAAIFGVMAACPQHTFQVLTKRAERLPEWFAWVVKRGKDGLRLFAEDPEDWRIRQMCHVAARRRGVDMNADRLQNPGGPWPLPNVHLGVSVEDQQRADERIPHLLTTPAAVRFVSAEPLLGPIDLVDFIGPAERMWDGNPETSSAKMARLDKLHWIIAGGESGPDARACDVTWIRSIVEQCKAARVACFVKQLGARPVVPQGCGDCDPCIHIGQHVCSQRYPVNATLRSKKGGDPAEWPEDLRVRQFPEAPR